MIAAAFVLFSGFYVLALRSLSGQLVDARSALRRADLQRQAATADQAKRDKLLDELLDEVLVHRSLRLLASKRARLEDASGRVLDLATWRELRREELGLVRTLEQYTVKEITTEQLVERCWAAVRSSWDLPS